MWHSLCFSYPLCNEHRGGLALSICTYELKTDLAGASVVSERSSSLPTVCRSRKICPFARHNMSTHRGITSEWTARDISRLFQLLLPVEDIADTRKAQMNRSQTSSPLLFALYSVPQNSFPLPTGSILSFATLGSALGKDYAGAIATLFCGTLDILDTTGFDDYLPRGFKTYV